MWKCTQASLAVWVLLINDGGVVIGLLSTLRKLDSPEGSFCCVNSECYFQFDPTPHHHHLPLVFHVVPLFQPLFSDILPPVFSPNGVGSIV